MDLNYASNPLINLFKLEAYHPIKKMFSITNSFLEYPKNTSSRRISNCKIANPPVG